MPSDIGGAMRIDLSGFRLHVRLERTRTLVLHFDTPSRRFYLSVIGLLVAEMKRLGQVVSVPLLEYLELLALLNETVGESAGSSDRTNLLGRIYRKWKSALPDLENAPLFRILGMPNGLRKFQGTAPLGEDERDLWASLFDYMGSDENVRLRFSVDRVGCALDDVVLSWEKYRDLEAWRRFVSHLRGTLAGKDEPEAEGAVAQTTGPSPVKVQGQRSVPVVAVLPLTNMTGKPGEDYFSDGLTEDIITELGRSRDLRVLARNTTFQYKGQAVDVPLVGARLGAHYLLEGSVRRAGKRVRINVQLIDVGTGAHVWAERYDREIRDIFAVQDEITGRVVGAVVGTRGAVQRAERAIAQSKGQERVEAYDLVLRATGPATATPDWYRDSKALLERAIALDPQYPRARQEYAWLMVRGWAHRLDGASEPPQPILENAIRSVELDPEDALAHRTAAFGYFFSHQLDLFEHEANRSLELAPYNAEILAQLGMLIALTGQWGRGAALARKAETLNASSAAGWFHTTMFYDRYLKGEYIQALEVIRQHPRQQLLETLFKHVMVYGEVGDRENAREYWARCIDLVPVFSSEWMRTNVFERWNVPPAETALFVEAIEKAAPQNRPL